MIEALRKHLCGHVLQLMLATSIVFSGASSLTHARDKEWRVVKAPHFGEVLFYFYQQKYFSAITHLMPAQVLSRLPRHEDEAELLLGGLYLSYGLHQKAGEIFQRLIDETAAPHVRDRAWFYIAKIWYQRGYLEQAVEALARIQHTLPAELQEERQVLGALVLMKQKRYQEAVRVLGEFKGRSEWAAYARYNMGVALIEVGDKSKGVGLLEDVGRMRAGSTEMKALKDKANLALGYAFLQVQGPERAQSYLRDVRLNGPFSNRALLGMGWALSARGRHQQALVPWMELQNRNPIDVAVQESLLAVPYSLRQLNANQQSLQHYETAIAVYDAETTRLGHAVNAIRAGKLLISELLRDPDSETGWFWRANHLSDTPESRYLMHLLATHAFHEALKNYRDLVFLSRNLAHWSENMDVFDAILETRRRGYEERLPRIMESYRSLDLTTLTRERDRYAQELKRIEDQGDAMALAGAKERDLIARLQRIKATIERMADTQDVTEYRQKYRIFSGLLLWKISTDYKPRLWRIKKTIRQLDKALTEARLRERSLQRIQKIARRGFEGYGKRSAVLRHRISLLQRKVDIAVRTHEDYLQELAATELERQRQRLRTYITQARFGIAQVYDRSISRVAVAQSPASKEERESKVSAQPAPSLPATTQLAKSTPLAGGTLAPEADKETPPSAGEAIARSPTTQEQGEPGLSAQPPPSAGEAGAEPRPDIDVASIDPNVVSKKPLFSEITERELSEMLRIFIADYEAGDLNG
ncbi:MAG: hypothetical protein ACE5NW_12890, partial [Acidiferrobacterales bacterium]